MKTNQKERETKEEIKQEQNTRKTKHQRKLNKRKEGKKGKERKGKTVMVHLSCTFPARDTEPVGEPACLCKRK